MSLSKQNILDIIAKELSFSFTLSSGPGGQNVNKNHTKAVARWSILASSLPDHTKTKLSQRLRQQLNKNREIIASAQESRSQEANQKRAAEKLLKIIRIAMHDDPRRVSTKPSRSSIKKRLDKKTQASEKKQWRKKVKL